MKNWITVSNLYLTIVVVRVLLLPELLSIQSAEENDFVVKYSPEVWKGNVNVWLGMYYDTNSKYNVTRRIQSMMDNFHGTRSCFVQAREGKLQQTFLQSFGENNLQSVKFILS